MAYKRSTFPETVDTLPELQDLPASLKPEADEYQTLKLLTNPTSDQIARLNVLTNELSQYMITPEFENKRNDIAIGMQIFFRDNVQGYITTKQGEFDSYINGKEAELTTQQNNVNNFVTTKETEMTNFVTTKTTEFNATLAKFTDKGNYDLATTYSQWNTVNYNYETYLSLQDNNTNHQPDISATWWRKMAQRGKQGANGLGLTMAGIYNNGTTYTINQCVSYNGSLWYALQTTTGNAPAVDSLYWAIFQVNVAPVIQPTEPESPSSGNVWIQTDV